MGFLDKLFRKDRDINAWVQDAAGVAGSVLLDVRTREEYRQGHIPGSVNVPLSELAAVDETISAKDTPLYVYCLSGGRSARAAALPGSVMAMEASRSRAAHPPRRGCAGWMKRRKSWCWNAPGMCRMPIAACPITWAM